MKPSTNQPVIPSGNFIVANRQMKRLFELTRSVQSANTNPTIGTHLYGLLGVLWEVVEGSDES